MSATKKGENGRKPSGEATNIDLGRSQLSEWEASQLDNFFTYDINFQRLLTYHWGVEKYRDLAKRLVRFGAVLATEVDRAVRITNEDENLPKFEPYDAYGRRVERILFHPSHEEAGVHIYGSGLLSVYDEPGNNVMACALFYLSSQNGEAGHNCPVACTAGLIKALQAVGSDALKKQYLPRLLDPDYRSNYTGAQFLTEVQGGSDVGANATEATLVDRSEGIWELNGEKWFCSNVSADLSLITARVRAQGKGTRGLGLFLLPRELENGRLNNMFIRRLKTKLGTRSMATAEVDFRDALAYQIGPTEQGFKNVMTYVINTSRIYNALGVAGNARRAYLTAISYAQYRTAFGRPIVHFPIVQDILANMRADQCAVLSGTFHLVSLIDDLEMGRAGNDAERFLRMALNLNKYRSAVLAHEVINRAIEILGGNGAIETFSVLPRLLRDNVVYENWEGTHNVLLAQVHRDIRRHRLDLPFTRAIEQMLNRLQTSEWVEAARDELKTIVAELAEVMEMDELTGAIYFRPLMNRLIDLYYTACLAVEGQWEHQNNQDRTKWHLATLFFYRRVLGQQPKDIAYYDDKVSRLCL